jgi:hypothetical protein
MGGINLVDVAPFSGSFKGTVVTGNHLFSNTSSASFSPDLARAPLTPGDVVIKIGIAVGSLSWGSNNNTAQYTNGGTISGNVRGSCSSKRSTHVLTLRCRPSPLDRLLGPLPATLDLESPWEVP